MFTPKTNWESHYIKAQKASQKIEDSAVINFTDISCIQCEEVEAITKSEFLCKNEAIKAVIILIIQYY